MGCANSLIVPQNGILDKKDIIENNDDKTIPVEHIPVIKRTWNILSRDCDDVGMKVLLRIIRLDPHTKEVMGLNDLEGGDLLQDMTFRIQAARIAEVLETAVKCVDELQNDMSPMLLELGKRHFNFQGFLPKYWSLVPRAVLYVWRDELQDQYTPEVPEAWLALLRFIMKKLKIGYHEACVAYTMNKLEEVIDDGK